MDNVHYVISESACMELYIKDQIDILNRRRRNKHITEYDYKKRLQYYHKLQEYNLQLINDDLFREVQ